MTRPGYLRWREELKRFHAQKAAEILKQLGYADEFIDRVQWLNLKRNFPHDPEGRVLEDALCLVFLAYQFADLARKTNDEKVINALQKAWRKMTPRAQELAKTISYAPRERDLLERALSSAPASSLEDA